MTMTKSRKAKREKKAPNGTPDPDKVAAPQRPGGKLGLMIDCLAASAGATADELAEATG